jgi:putative membrane protein
VAEAAEALLGSGSARFWRQAFAYRGSATPRSFPRTLVFGAIAVLVVLLNRRFPALAIPVGPIEVSGAVVAVILVLRTNAGYERWWEGRKLWGGIVNQTRNLAISAHAYGPNDGRWRDELVRWCAAFPHVIRRSLRDERDLPELVPLVGDREAKEVAAAQHMPSWVADRIASLLATARPTMDGFAFMQIDEQRALLLDHAGGCERIKKTPIAYAYAVLVRRFIVVYLLLVPFGIVDTAGELTPLITMFISYPMLSLDDIAAELQQPFSLRALSHLPLDEICQTIEANVMALPGGTRKESRDQ